MTIYDAVKTAKTWGDRIRRMLRHREIAFDKRNNDFPLEAVMLIEAACKAESGRLMSPRFVSAQEYPSCLCPACQEVLGPLDGPRKPCEINKPKSA